MSKADDLHRQAMELADEADLARIRDRDLGRSRGILRQAYEKDRLAALELVDRIDYEPTRSVYFRSAASLAFEIDEPEAAEVLIELALQGTPPQPIEEELRTLRKNLHSKAVAAALLGDEAPVYPLPRPEEDPRVSQLMGLAAAIESYLEEAMVKIPPGARQVLLENYELTLPSFENSGLPSRDSKGTYSLRKARLILNWVLESLLENRRAEMAIRHMEREQAIRWVRAIS